MVNMGYIPHYTKVLDHLPNYTDPPMEACGVRTTEEYITWLDVVLAKDEPNTVEGDHKISDESVDVDRSVCSGNSASEGLHDRDVTPAS